MNDNLHQAYMETTYVVFEEEEKSYSLKINTIAPNFDKWRKTNTVDSWAIITAYNPFSKELSEDENNKLNLQLETLIRQNGFSYYKAKGVPKNTNWKAEDSFFIWNISLKKAQEIGVFFKQNAIVYGNNTKPITLVWLV